MAWLDARAAAIFRLFRRGEHSARRIQRALPCDATALSAAATSSSLAR
jgi:hypothetical protein